MTERNPESTHQKKGLSEVLHRECEICTEKEGVSAHVGEPDIPAAEGSGSGHAIEFAKTSRETRDLLSLNLTNSPSSPASPSPFPPCYHPL